MAGVGEPTHEPAADKSSGADHQYAHAAILRFIERIP
jgi:hypothetical protein